MWIQNSRLDCDVSNNSKHRSLTITKQPERQAPFTAVFDNKIFILNAIIQIVAVIHTAPHGILRGLECRILVTLL